MPRDVDDAARARPRTARGLLRRKGIPERARVNFQRREVFWDNFLTFVQGVLLLRWHSILFPLEIGYIARETLLVTQITLYGQT